MYSFDSIKPLNGRRCVTIRFVEQSEQSRRLTNFQTFIFNELNSNLFVFLVMACQIWVRFFT